MLIFLFGFSRKCLIISSRKSTIFESVFGDLLEGIFYKLLNASNKLGGVMRMQQSADMERRRCFPFPGAPALLQTWLVGSRSNERRRKQRLSSMDPIANSEASPLGSCLLHQGDQSRVATSLNYADFVHFGHWSCYPSDFHLCMRILRQKMQKKSHKN